MSARPRPRVASLDGIRRVALRGAGVGCAFSIAEGAIFAGAAIFEQAYPLPAHLILLDAAFLIGIGAVTALIVAPLRRIHELAHLAATGAVLGLAFLGAAPDTGATTSLAWMTIATAALLIGCGAAFRALGRRRHQRALFSLPAACGILGVCSFAALPSLLAESPGSSNGLPVVGGAKGSNIVLFVVDTVRADRTSLLSHSRDTTPMLASLGASGVVFTRAVSPANCTVPAHASLFTGTFPSRHGAHRETNHLSGGASTLAEILAQRGYETAAFAANPWIIPSTGLTQGFRHVAHTWTRQIAPEFLLLFRLAQAAGVFIQDKGGRDAVALAVDWLASRDRERPFFVFVNVVESHVPYHVLPSDFRRLYVGPEVGNGHLRHASTSAWEAGLFGAPVADGFDPLIEALYDAGIAYSDLLLERMVTTLEREDLLEDTLLVVVSDHGESLGENGLWGHEHSVHETLLHVPLVIHAPGRVAPARIEEPVSTASVFATILESEGFDAPPGSAPSLWGRLGEGRPLEPAPVISESMRWTPSPLHAGGGSGMQRIETRYRAYRSADHKLVLDEHGGRWLFDLGADPGEQRDLAEERPELADRLEAELRDWEGRLSLPELAADLSGSGPAPIDARSQRQLEALGYVVP